MSSGPAHPGVLVGVDGSPSSRVAVRWAAHEATVRNIPLTPVHVVSTPAVNSSALSWPAVPIPAELRQWQEDPAAKVMADAIKLVEDSRPAGGRDRPPTRPPHPCVARAASRARLVGAAPSAPARLPTLRRTTPRRSGDPAAAAPPLCLHLPPLLDRAAGHRPARHRPGGARRCRSCAATPPAAAVPPRSGRHLRRGADRVPVLRTPLDESGRRRRCSPRMDPSRRGSHPGGHRDDDVQRIAAVRGGLSRSRPPRRSHRLADMATPCGR